MIENPFFHRGPIKEPDYFYNRQVEVKRVLEMLKKGQCVSIIGPRKIGKTSLLFHISNPTVLKKHGFDLSIHLPVYITCEGLGTLRQEELYTLILREIQERAEEIEYTLTLPERPVAHIDFERTLKQAFAQNIKLILLLDEFEWLSSNQHLGPEFFSGLRALANKHDIAYVTTSQHSLAVLSHIEKFSPFFNIFVSLSLGLFGESESQSLIKDSLSKSGATLSPQIIDLVLETGGGHPFFLQIAGYSALELRERQDHSPENGQRHPLIEYVRRQMEGHLAYYWNHLSQLQQYILASLPLSQKDIKYRRDLEELADQCLIVKKNNSCKYFSPLLRDFIRGQKVKDILQAGPVVIDRRRRRTLLRDKPLELAPLRFELLTYLVARAGEVVSNEELDRKVLWGHLRPDESYTPVDDERLKSTIKALRRSLGPDANLIANRRGVGYTFQVSLD